MRIPLPLEDITVVEMGSSVAGPYAARILLDMGAEVVKVETPKQGDTSRSWGEANQHGASAVYQCMNRGKKSVTVDLNDAAQVEVLRQFISSRADVVLQNLRPHAAERFGLGSEKLTALNPRLVYCNEWSFGSVGPLSHLPGYDPMMQAYSGIADCTGEAGGGPCRVGPPIIDLGTGMWSAMGILGLLQRRNTTGQGGVVDTSLYETGLAFLTLQAAIYQSTGVAPERSGLQGPMVAPNGGYSCADGDLVIVCATENQFRRMCEAIDARHLLEDPRFATSNQRRAHHADLAELLSAVLSSESRSYWSEKLNAANVPNAPVNSLPEALENAQTEACGLDQLAPDGDLRVLASPMKFDGERRPFERYAPQLGADNEEILEISKPEPAAGEA